ncbi:hypothetical protein CRM94_19275 [Burkholderia gladioli]|uniref:Uncharacterized protein n=1 Tax=Burkholderia gladioli TaxID=28095 RepID=A0A2A7RZJ6_BURGA|nr:hypothetical protein EDD84_03610 [Burkholderia gladioli]PEH36751.1 hypothetical protein CRM94_19275 [Burkholderia gladioli]
MGWPLASVETVSISTTGIHQAAALRSVGLPSASEQRKMNDSGNPLAGITSFEWFQAYFTTIVPGCGVLGA